MTQALAISVFVCGPLAAGLLPYLLRHTTPLRMLKAIMKPGRTQHFHPVLPRVSPARSSGSFRHHANAGAVLATCVLMSYIVYQVWPTGSESSLVELRNALLVGLGGGLLLLLGLAFLRYGASILRAARTLNELGVVAVWNAGRPQSPPFASSLLATLRSERRIDAIGTDGRNFLSMLSDPSGHPLSAPHPKLRGTKIRLLLVPPRGRRTDPERRDLTSAEEALMRLQIKPEDHWRSIQEILEVRHRWVQDHEVSLDIRFLETRPTFAAMIVGDRAWYRTWQARQSGWLEVRDGGNHHGQLVCALNNHFVSAWASASREFCFDLASGPTSGSTFLRKSKVPRPPKKLAPLI